MNNYQILIKRNNVARLIRPMNRTRNALKWSANESISHILMKLKICHYLKQQGKEFFTEAIFMDGSRADVINADDGIIYEVVNSEKEESIIRKKKKYPLPLIVVNANQEFKEELLW